MFLNLRNISNLAIYDLSRLDVVKHLLFRMTGSMVTERLINSVSVDLNKIVLFYWHYLM